MNGVIQQAWASHLQISKSWPRARSASLVEICCRAMLNLDSAYHLMNLEGRLQCR